MTRHLHTQYRAVVIVIYINICPIKFPDLAVLPPKLHPHPYQIWHTKYGAWKIVNKLTLVMARGMFSHIFFYFYHGQGSSCHNKISIVVQQITPVIVRVCNSVHTFHKLLPWLGHDIFVCELCHCHKGPIWASMIYLSKYHGNGACCYQCFYETHIQSHISSFSLH